MRMRLSVAWLVLALLWGTVGAQQGAPPIGSNLSAVVSYSADIPFVDLFRTARPWISQRAGADWGEGGPLDLTPEGWVRSLAPGQYAETLMMDEFAHFPRGEYVLLYEGEGEIGFNFGSARVLQSEPGRMLIEPSFNSSLFLQILATNPENPIRNIRLILPGFEASYAEQPFFPLFLERMAPFKVLRFMDWMETNNSVIREWDERPQVTDATQSLGKGVALEIMVALANTLAADAWFNMPHAASDEYVRRFAEQVRDTLDPALRVYIEYSNETWNGQFTQASYVIDQGLALGLSGDAFQAGLFYHSRRAREIFAIWEEVFGGTERLVRVVAAQAANVWTGEQVLDFEQAYEAVDAIAIAPYFGQRFGTPEQAAQTLSLGLDGLFPALQADIAGEVSEWMRLFAALAANRGVVLVAYEGGQHLVGVAGMENDEALTALLQEANRDPRMYDRYREYLAAWAAAGGGLFVNFSSADAFSKWGSWGMLEYLAQPIEESPKYRALLDAIAGR